MMMVSRISWFVSAYICTQPTSFTVIESCWPPQTVWGVIPSRFTMAITIGRRRFGVLK